MRTKAQKQPKLRVNKRKVGEKCPRQFPMSRLEFFDVLAYLWNHACHA